MTDDIETAPESPTPDAASRLARIDVKIHQAEYGPLGSAQAVLHDIIKALTGQPLAEEVITDQERLAREQRKAALAAELAQLGN